MTQFLCFRNFVSVPHRSSAKFAIDLGIEVHQANQEKVIRFIVNPEYMTNDVVYRAVHEQIMCNNQRVIAAYPESKPVVDERTKELKATYEKRKADVEAYAEYQGLKRCKEVKVCPFLQLRLRLNGLSEIGENPALKAQLFFIYQYSYQRPRGFVIYSSGLCINTAAKFNFQKHGQAAS